MQDEPTWSDGLANLPGVGYRPPPGVRPPRLPRSQLVPRVGRHEFDGDRHVSHDWATDGGSTSASPASRYFSGRDAPVTTREVLDRLHAGLALPGTPSDYHFAIQHAIEAVWKRRHTDPDAAAVVERLCLLDLHLVEAYPDPFRSGGSFAVIHAARLLVQLYEGAGDLEAALAAARRVEPMLNGTQDVTRLEGKLRLMHEEELP